MTQTGYLYDTAFLSHTLQNHPENRERLEAVMSLLSDKHMLEQLRDIKFTAASREQLCRVHDPVYVNALERMSQRAGGMMGADTYVNGSSYHAASMAVGAATAATRAVLRGDVKSAFALVRPPGHHAFADHGEGFCLFNNCAFAALYALGDSDESSAGSLSRVMIVDWDVHHGNGTESIFHSDPRVLYVSTHQTPLYPGTGRMTDVGSGAGRGTTVNIPLPPGTGDNGYMKVFHDIVAPLARRFQPQLIVMSAGYDAHWRDTLAAMKMSLSGFASIVSTLVELSEELCAGKLISVLEGGYDLEVLSYGVLNTLYIMDGMADRLVDPPGPFKGRETSVDNVIRLVRQIHNI
jgi:acetoin utilization deacetylase AcuC-like enzyme